MVISHRKIPWFQSPPTRFPWYPHYSCRYIIPVVPGGTVISSPTGMLRLLKSWMFFLGWLSSLPSITTISLEFTYYSWGYLRITIYNYYNRFYYYITGKTTINYYDWLLLTKKCGARTEVKVSYHWSLGLVGTSRDMVNPKLILGRKLATSPICWHLIDSKLCNSSRYKVQVNHIIYIYING